MAHKEAHLAVAKKMIRLRHESLIRRRIKKLTARFWVTVLSTFAVRNLGLTRHGPESNQAQLAALAALNLSGPGTPKLRRSRFLNPTPAKHRTGLIGKGSKSPVSSSRSQIVARTTPWRSSRTNEPAAGWYAAGPMVKAGHTAVMAAPQDSRFR